MKTPKYLRLLMVLALTSILASSADAEEICSVKFNILGASMKNNTENAVLVLAVYNDNGVLQSVTSKAIAADETVIFENIGNGYRIFAWDSFEEMNPLAHCVGTN